MECLLRPLWRARAPHSDANDAIIAVPIEIFVQASSRSVGVRLNRAAQEMGIAIRPSAGRPPFSKIDAATSSACSGDARSSWVASETKSPANSGLASDTFRTNASTSRSSG